MDTVLITIKTLIIMIRMAVIPGVIIVLYITTANAENVTISAAASMTNAVSHLAEEYKKHNPDTTLRLNFGSSGSLAKQIKLGAPADIFISANPKWMDYLINTNSITRANVRTFAANTLVFIGAPTTRSGNLSEIVSLSRIAIGSPKSVPAGQYASQALKSAGIYDTLIAGNTLVMAKDVRQALMYAERGEADGAFVYKTDALLASHAIILFTIPQSLYDPIKYPIALTVKGKGNADAVIFFDYLISDSAKPVLVKFGFGVTPHATGAGS